MLYKFDTMHPMVRPGIAAGVNSANTLSASLSHVEQELIVNMVTYYGLPCDIVLMILQFYKANL